MKRLPPQKLGQKKGCFFGILEDKEGGIWFGTLNGVCRYDGNTFNYFKDTGVNAGAKAKVLGGRPDEVDSAKGK